MNLPFTPDQFFNVFAEYNNSIWPFHIVFYFLAFVSVYVLLKPHQASNKIISVVLAFFWLWMGIVYHGYFFAQINPAAKIFGALFVVQGLLFLYTGIIKHNLNFSFQNKINPIVGLFLILFGTVIYPLIGYVLGHRFPYSPTFGLPCPTTIFTFGVLLSAVKLPKYLVVIPFLWSLLGFTAALQLGVMEDISLLISGVVSASLILIRPKNYS